MKQGTSTLCPNFTGYATEWPEKPVESESEIREHYSRGQPMKKKSLGKKHVCYQCGCKFYDLKKARRICPKCGVNQDDAPQPKGSSQQATRQKTSAHPSRTRARKRKENDWNETNSPFSEDDNESTDSLGDDLSLIEEDGFTENEEADSPELD